MSAIDGPRLLKYVAKLLLYVYKKKGAAVSSYKWNVLTDRGVKMKGHQTVRKIIKKKKMVGDKEQL